MEWVETTGRTIAEALDAALDELGVDEDDVEYEVLEEPKSGFLGRLGSSEGRIRARVKPISREKPGERQRRKGRGSSRARGRRRRRQRRRWERRPERRGRAARPPASRPRPAGERRRGGGSSNRRRRGGRGGGGNGGGGDGTRGNEARTGATSRIRRDARPSSRGAPWRPPSTTYRSRSRPRRPRRSPRVWSTPSSSARRAKSVIDDDVRRGRGHGGEPRAARRPEGRDAPRDRGARPHGRAAPDRRPRRADPRRRGRLPGQAARGARRVHPRAGREGARDRSARRRSSRCRPATARSSTTPPPRSTASPPRPRARTLAAAWCSARPDPTHRRPADRPRPGREILEDARSTRPARPRTGRRVSSATPPTSHARSAASPAASSTSGAAAGCPGWCWSSEFPEATAVLLDAQQRRGEFLRGALARLGVGDRVEVVVGRAEVLARDRVAPGHVRPRGRAVVRRTGGDRRVRGRVPPGRRVAGGHRAPGIGRTGRSLARGGAGPARARTRGRDPPRAAPARSGSRRRVSSTSDGPGGTGFRPSARSGRATATVPRGTVSLRGRDFLHVSRGTSLTRSPWWSRMGTRSAALWDGQ